MVLLIYGESCESLLASVGGICKFCDGVIQKLCELNFFGKIMEIYKINHGCFLRLILAVLLSQLYAPCFPASNPTVAKNENYSQSGRVGIVM